MALPASPQTAGLWSYAALALTVGCIDFFFRARCVGQMQKDTASPTSI